MRKPLILGGLAAVVLIVALILAVVPRQVWYYDLVGRYKYVTVDTQCHFLRVDRFTGRVDRYDCFTARWEEFRR